MNTWVLYAIDTLFIVAVVAPPLSVTIYRWKVVPFRRAEIENVMRLAFECQDEAMQKAAREALENNPYISNPKETFDYYHNPWRYIFPLLVLTVLTASCAYIAYAWVYYRIVPPATVSSGASSHISLTSASDSAPSSPAQVPASSSPISVPLTVQALMLPGPIAARLPLVIIMALAGGYIWAVYQILARVRALELSPADLYEIDLGLLAAVPVGIAFSLITVELEGVRDFIAFTASAFPLRDVSRMVRQYAIHKVLTSSDASARSTDASAARPPERHLGTSIEGLSDQTLARLSELRITTVLDMAYNDPIKIMVQTGFPLPVIIDWIDQSIWALYAGDLKAKITKSGIRCSLDVCEFVDLHLRDEEGKKRATIDGSHKEALDALSKMMETKAVLLQDLFFRIYNDPQVLFLRKMWYPTGVPKDLRA